MEQRGHDQFEGSVAIGNHLATRQQRTDATVIRVIGRTVRHDSALSLLHDNVPSASSTLHVADGSDAHPKSIATSRAATATRRH